MENYNSHSGSDLSSREIDISNDSHKEDGGSQIQVISRPGICVSLMLTDLTRQALHHIIQIFEAGLRLAWSLRKKKVSRESYVGGTDII